ncbi:MAG: MYG1 family protein [Candidatus Paceibacterota bacterium]|jgi:uncharacterized UPF0160 family protein
MSFFKKNKILITHNGAFHADDLFAASTLSILNNGNVKIIRTRDPKIITSGDYVFDVGGEYNPEKNKFDHHQKGGAGVRPNGIPYSSFGLVWKKFGKEICGDEEVVDYIDYRIVQPIDAIDNGVDISLPKFGDLHSYSAQNIFKAFYPTWKEDVSGVDRIFNDEVKKIIPLLKREIKVAQDDVEAKKMIMEIYNTTEDKRIIILDKPFHRSLLQDVLPTFPEPVYFIYPSGHGHGWKIEAVRKDTTTHESRKLFPESWRGLMNGDQKLKEISGVPDIVFCHQSGFFAHVKSKEGAIALAEKALLA